MADPSNSFRSRQLRSFEFGELEQRPKHAATLGITVSPPPVLDELPSTLHALVIDAAGADLRPPSRGTARLSSRSLTAHDTALPEAAAGPVNRTTAPISAVRPCCLRTAETIGSFCFGSVARNRRFRVTHSGGGWPLHLVAAKLLGVLMDVQRCDMSMLQQIIEGSLVSRQRLMQAREFYSPSERNVPARVAFARWTNRVLEQPALAVARELAGLSGPELDDWKPSSLVARCVSRPWVRHAVVVGIVLMVLAGLGLGLQALTSLGETAGRTLQAASIACLLIGLLPLGVGLISAFGAVHLDLSYGTTGLYVGKLDEQHPWLYDALSLTRHGVAEDYRQRTLRERGLLRGADYVMMRELVQAQEALERVRAARSVAEQFQSLPLAAQAIVHEPRLVRVGAARDRSEPLEAELSRLAAK